MRKFLRLMAIILVFTSILFIQPMQALASTEVPLDSKCNSLLARYYGFRRVGNYVSTPLTLISDNGELTGLGQGDDPYNSVTLSASADNTTIGWSATLGIDAVIVQGTSKAYAYTYSPESSGATDLKVGTTGEAISYIELCFDYELTATISATPLYEKTVNWSIAKSASAASVSAFTGQPGNLEYTVTLTKDEIFDLPKVSGTITIHNRTPLNVYTWNVTLTVGGAVTAKSCSLNPNSTIVANQIVTCSYSTNLGSPVDGTSVAVVTGSAYVPGTTASVDYAFKPATVKTGSEPDTITVTDLPSTSLGQFTTPPLTPLKYTNNVACSSDPAKYSAGHYQEILNNTVRIDQTNETANASATLHCYAPIVSKTAAGKAYYKVTWGITKTAAEAVKDRLAGDSAIFNYNIHLEKTRTEGPWFVDGTITVENPAGAPGAMNVNVSDALPGATLTCGSSLSVPQGESRTCGYSAEVTSAAAGTNTATVSLNGANFSATSPYTFAAATLYPGSGPDEVTVMDTQGNFGKQNSTIDIPYNRTENCPNIASAYSSSGVAVLSRNNTAWIEELPAISDSVTTTLNCYAPVVSKIATASYTERHNWSLSKTADPAGQNALAGQTANYNWNIQVNHSMTEEDYGVSGQISVQNPAPVAMTLTLSDVLNDGAVGTITGCTGGSWASGSLTIQPDTTASCSYAAAPAGRNATLNTATATLNGIAFLSSSGFTWVAEPVNASVTLDDDQNPGLPKTITSGGSYPYTDSYTCSTSPTAYSIGHYKFSESNTAVLKSGDIVLSSITADAAVDCYAPLLSKTASANYTEQHDWILAKTVAPETQALFAGQTASYTWAIEVTESVTENSFAVSGKISVANPAPIPMTASLSDVLSDTTQAKIGPCTNGSLANGLLTIPANTTAICDYLAEPAGKTALSNTATVALNGYTLSSSIPLTWVASPVNPTVTLDDDQNPNLPQDISGTTILSYKDSHVCPTNPASYTNGLAAFSESNTVTLKAGGLLLDSKTATVSVNCYAPIVSKTANAIYNAQHTWTLDKTVSPTNQKAFAGASVPITWTITVGHQVVETGITVTGQITIINPSGEAMHVDLIDSLGDGTLATISGCEMAGTKLTIPASSTATCNYTAAPPDRKAGTNTAVVILNGIEFAASHALDWVATATNPKVILDDDRNPAFPIELTDGGVFTYPETPVCSNKPEDYVGGYFTFAALNTAKLSAGTTVLAQDNASFNMECYAPLVSKTAAGTTYKGINWSITKTADQPTAVGLAGGSATLSYTLALDKQLESLRHLVEGNITIQSPTGAPTPMNLSVTDLVVPTGMNTVAAVVDCDPVAQGNQDTLSLSPGATKTCTYVASLDSPTGGTNTAFVRLNEVYFHHLVNYTFETTDLSKSEPETVTVSDSMAGDLGSFSESTPAFHYTASAACPVDPGLYVNGVASVNVLNKAMINETANDESSASVLLTCYAPTVSKTAVATAYKSVNWRIAKQAKQPELKAFAGQSATFDYTVTLTKDETSGLNVVQGMITVANPTQSLASMALSVVDQVKPANLPPVTAVVDCDANTAGNQPTLTLAAGASASCTYYAELPSATNGVNTATVTLNGLDFSATVPYAFGEQVEGVTEPGTVTVTDSLVGALGQFTATGTKDYSYMATCPTSPTAFTAGVYIQQISNTASINETQNDSASAAVTLKCFAPVVSKTATAVAYESIDWTLDKVGIQPPYGGFAGTTVNFDYQLTATKQVMPGPFLVSGEINLTNPAGAPGEMVFSVSDDTGGVATNVDCDSQAAGDQPGVTLQPGQSVACTYKASLPEAVNGINTATVTAGGLTYTATAAYTFGEPVLAEGSEPRTINVIDGVDAWSVSETKTWYTTIPQTCPADPAAYTDGLYSSQVINTATINETEDADSATLDLECYAPVVFKTATAKAYTTLDWTLTKTAVPASLSLFAGQSAEVEYTLDLVRNEAMGPNVVKSTITVKNPHPSQALEVAVIDVAGGVTATVDCDTLTEGDQAQLTIPAGETRTCTALANLPEAVDGSNIASVILPPPAAGVPFTATAVYSFEAPQPSPLSEPLEVSIDDSLGGMFGPFTAETSITYKKTVSCPVDLKLYTDGVIRSEVQNSAEVAQTQDIARSVVDLECFAPVMTKTASALWTKDIDWTVAKAVTPVSVDLKAGESADFAYTVVLDKHEIPGIFVVSGAVVLSNPAEAPDAITLSVTDLLKPTGHPDVPVTLECIEPHPDPANLLLQPGETAHCAYRVTLDGKFDGENTATVVMGEETFTLSAAYAFGEGELVIGSDPDTVTLFDIFNGQPEDKGSFSSSQTLQYTHTLTCPADAAAYTDGLYSFTATNTAKLSTGYQDEQTVTVNCTLPGSPAQVIKVIDQGSQAIGQFPIQFALYPPEAAEPVETITLAEADVTGDGAYTLPFETLVTPGTWKVVELLPEGWYSNETTCTLEVPENHTGNDIFTCNFSNTELSRLRLGKTTNGKVDPTRDWKFTLIPAGEVGVYDSTLGDADGWLDFGGSNLDPSQVYTICELTNEKKWASVWSVGGVILPGYYAGAYHCLDIGFGTALPLHPGEELVIHVDNVSTLGATGSSGYWKNSDQLEALLSRYTFTIGILQLGGSESLSMMRMTDQDDVLIVQMLLDMRDLSTGKKMASDAIYQLAAELLVYRLNQANGACIRPEAEAVANSAQALLVSVGFNGRGSYVRNPEATLKAAALARYNNSAVCGK